MKNKLEKLRADFLQELGQVKNSEYLRELELKYLSRKGELSLIMGELKDLSVDLRREVGELANKIKVELQTRFEEVSRQLAEGSIKKELIDVTLPGETLADGHHHHHQ